MSSILRVLSSDQTGLAMQGLNTAKSERRKKKRSTKAASKRDRKVSKPQGIVLVPTRELALQVNNVFEQIFETINTRTNANKFDLLQCTTVTSGEKRHLQRLR